MLLTQPIDQNSTDIFSASDAIKMQFINCICASTHLLLVSPKTLGVKEAINLIISYEHGIVKQRFTLTFTPDTKLNSIDYVRNLGYTFIVFDTKGQQTMYRRINYGKIR